MPTNLQSDITEVRARLGEPYRTDEADSFFLDSEIIDWIYYGELKVWNDLPASVLVNGTSLGAWVNLTTSRGVNFGYYDLATRTTSYKLLRVACQDVTNQSGWSYIAGRKVSPDTWRQIITGKSTNYERVGYDASSATRRFYWSEDEDGVIYSTSNVSDTISAYIIDAPSRRYKHVRDTSQATSNATTITMSTAQSAIFNVANFFVNCGIKLVSGNMAGAQTTVTSHTTATPNVITCPTLGFNPGNVFLYEMGDVSAFNDNLREPAILHACYLAALKDESPERSQGFLALYERAIAALKGPAS